MGDREALSTGGHADFVFEVAPDRDVFDTVRRAVLERLEDGYQDVVVDDVRTHLRIDTVRIEPSIWRVDGELNGGNDVDFGVRIRADTEATSDVLSYLRTRVDERYGSHVRSEVVAFERIGLRPNAWFVDAKIPPATGRFADGDREIDTDR